MTSFFKRNLLKIMFFLLSVSMSCNLLAGANKIENASFAQLINEHKTLEHGKQSFEENKAILWQKYLKDVQGLIEQKSEYDNRALKFNDKTMRFTLEKRGIAPKDGYPLYIALHGGGQTSSGMNDSQWHAMSAYYRNSVQDGIYVAPRGITNNWKLHFEDESYPLYDKLIESAILFDGVNPNRVYLLGFSAGGDGVYQVVPRMPERFAAANMSAGHHNWITFDNLANTPFLMQVGENDTAFKRNRVAAENNVTMNNLKVTYGKGFIHDVFIHYNGSHNSWRDNDASRSNQTIIADPIAWLSGNRDKTFANTNAIDWLNHYSRNPAPEKIVWDLNVGANSRVYQTGAGLLGKEGYKAETLAQPNTLFYWLDVSVANPYPQKGKLVVEIVKSSNTIKVLEAKEIDKFRILLNPNLLDLSAPVKVEVGNQLIGTVNVKEELAIMTRTLLERSDINEIYDGEITLAYNKEQQKWEVSI